MEATFQDKKQRHTGSATLVGIGHKHIYKRVHTRFVVAEVGSPLEAFPSSKVMFGAIHDAFQAHKQAYEECGIIHRDVSGGNILILDNNEGLLNDWDLAKKEAEDQDATLVPDRTGTWQFMSFGLLQDPYKRHTARGDLESFFWLVLCYGLHYLSHSFTKNVPAIMADIFDKFTFTHPDGVARGGTTKVALVTANFNNGRRPRPLIKSDAYRFSILSFAENDPMGPTSSVLVLRLVKSDDENRSSRKRRKKRCPT
ncbi:hypothetical protein PC9H_000093 [Pleurotus ostreatus]|uniref:Protein kinase domain-containing protein n=1 Tax=Pleurotus ostreatus TaxID=5322 RepID=A0A8H7A425_PLEOS|nr:uncharacterized protein PC9H_000093 [Pleurotus ostreatus]KAF7439757.1 hypothetical protein PC9H_000093 [Pleurotus ostreatus]KAJ8701079.1 hypothetical protein PTI98_004042 [Pleurotus ostreatus]